MIHVVADTTAYRADPKRDKAAFRAIARLAHAGYLVLHIPDIVRREFVSQQRQQYSKHIQALRAELHDFGRRSLPTAVADYVGGVLGRLAPLDVDLRAFAEDEFAEWASAMSAVIHPIGQSHGGRVVEAYFAGALPFREPKHRDDFPDAFLWQVIIDLAEQHNPLYVVSSDKGIFNAAQGVEGVTPFDSLEDFVASEPFQALLKAHFASANIKALLALLPEHLDFVSAALANELVDELAGRTVRSDEIPDDNSEAIISMVGNPEDLDLDIAAAVDHGDGLFVVPFSLRTECLLDYAIFKGDFYTLPDEKSDRISTSELNEHYYSAEEYYTLRVDGLLSFEVGAEALRSTDLSEDDLVGILEDATITVDSIEDIEVVDPPEND
jgi:hypothetical protein